MSCGPSLVSITVFTTCSACSRVLPLFIMLVTRSSKRHLGSAKSIMFSLQKQVASSLVDRVAFKAPRLRAVLRVQGHRSEQSEHSTGRNRGVPYIPDSALVYQFLVLIAHNA